MEQHELLTQYLDSINRAIEITYATLSTISNQRDDESISWTVVGIMDQIEKVKEYTSKMDEILSEMSE